MCSSMRCYLWSVIVQEKKDAGHLFEFLMTLLKAYPFPKLMPYFLIRLEKSVFDKILSSTLRKKCYVIWSHDFLWTILNNPIQSKQDTTYLCLAIHIRFKKVQKCSIYLRTTSCPPTRTPLRGHSSPLPVHLPSAPSGSAPSSCCQCAAVTTAGTTCHRAQACSPCSDVHLPPVPCLRLSAQADPPRMAVLCGFVPWPLLKPTCLQVPQKPTRLPSDLILIRNQANLFLLSGCLYKSWECTLQVQRIMAGQQFVYR